MFCFFERFLGWEAEVGWKWKRESGEKKFRMGRLLTITKLVTSNLDQSEASVKVKGGDKIVLENGLLLNNGILVINVSEFL